jgi:cytochrome c biogenesis protein CcdA
MLAGMALTFAGVATLAAVGGSWAVQANELGRLVAIVLVAVFGLALLLTGVATGMAQPLVELGSRLSSSAEHLPATGQSLVVGVATGLLWAPCAGPILGLILTGAALRGASLETSGLLAVYAAGAATSLAIVLAVGGRALRAMRGLLGVGEWLRRALGTAVLVSVVVVALGLDSSVLAQVSLSNTTSLEQGLLDTYQPAAAAEPATAAPQPESQALQLPALGPAGGSGPIRFRVTIDGAPPGADHGVDVGDDGTATVTDQRLYQLVRTAGGVADHLFEIQFLDPGVQAYSFTFG